MDSVDRFSYLANRTQFVDINGSFLTKRNIGVGVPQGSVLGPLLYILYTSHVADILRRRLFPFRKRSLPFLRTVVAT